ncbi:hypothetical protein HDV01_003205 [Terramyces sp. JEL0728]|nr:hypothetical protein HDV01_003205 [Terramyces sp. JEL0728]
MDNKDEQLPTYEAVVENIVDVDELEKKPFPPQGDIGSSFSTSTKGNEMGSSFNFFGLTAPSTEYTGTLNSTGSVETLKLVVQPFAAVHVFFEEIQAIQIDYKIESKTIINHCQDLKRGKYVAEITTKGRFVNWFSGKPGQVIVRIPTHFRINVDFKVCGELIWNGGPSLLQDVDIKSSYGIVRIDKMYATDIEVHSSAGGIAFSNSTSSKIVLKSSGGTIKSYNVTADNVRIKCSAGEIECTEYKVTNEAEIKASGGSIKAHIDFIPGAKGEADIHTSAGSVQAIVTGYNDTSIKSSAGSVKADLMPLKKSDTKLVSSAGSVTANIKDFHGTYKCKASVGSAIIRRNGEKVTPTNDVLPGPGYVKAHSSAGSVTVNFEY